MIPGAGEMIVGGKTITKVRRPILRGLGGLGIIGGPEKAKKKS